MSCPQGGPQRWHGFSWWSLPDFHCQRMKNSPGLPVPGVVAPFLHHLWNNGARSVNKDHGFFFQLLIKLEISNLMATTGYFLIYVFNKTLFPPLPTWSEHQEMIRTCPDLSELPVSLQNHRPDGPSLVLLSFSWKFTVFVGHVSKSKTKNRGNGW